MYTDQWQKSESQFLVAYSSLMNFLEGMDSDLLNTEMQQGKWSPGQTMAHLHLATIGSLERAIKKVGAPERLKRRNLSIRIKGFLLLFFLRSNRKFKAPASTEVVAERISFEELQSSFKTVESLLAELKSKWTEDLISLSVFTHPVAGPIDMATFYKFLLEHTLHHKRQIDAFIENRGILHN